MIYAPWSSWAILLRFAETCWGCQFELIILDSQEKPSRWRARILPWTHREPQVHPTSESSCILPVLPSDKGISNHASVGYLWSLSEPARFVESQLPLVLQNNVVTNWRTYTVTSPLLKHLGIDGGRMWTMLRYAPLLILSIFLVFIFQKWWGARGAVSNCCSVYIHKLLHFCAWVFSMSWVHTIKSLCTIHNIMKSAFFSGAEQLKSSNSSRSKRQFLEMFVNLDVNTETFNLYKTFVFLSTCLACDYEFINIWYFFHY